MKENTPNNEQIELLHKYLAGHTSAEEVKRAEKLIRTDPECKKYWNEVFSVFEYMAAAGTKPNKSPEEAYSDFLKTVESEKAESVFVAKSRTIPLLIKIAALLIIFFGSWKTIHYLVHEKLRTVCTANTIKPAVQFPDGSLITLNQNSEIRFPGKFKKKERIVFFRGEGYFTVKSKENYPFVILMDDCRLIVTGTAFNVYTRPETDSIEVSVDTGTVFFTKNLSEKHELHKISSGERLRANTASGKTIKEIIKNPNHRAWETGILHFDHTPLREVADILMRTYRVKILIPEEATGKYKLSARFNHKSLPFIFEALEFNFGLTVLNENGTYTFTNHDSETSR